MFKKYKITGISELSAHKSNEGNIIGREIIVKSCDVSDDGVFIGALQLPIADNPLNAWTGGITYIRGASVKEI